MNEGHGDLDAGQEADATEEDDHEQGELERKVEELQHKVAQQFEDMNDEHKGGTPIIKAPHQPTEIEWARHCVTHTPYAPWCPHCVAGRAVRRQHPKQSR